MKSQTNSSNFPYEYLGGNVLSEPFQYRIQANQNGQQVLVFTQPSWVWPNALIPYKLSSCIIERNQIRQRITEAIQRYYQQTPIRFQDITGQNLNIHSSWIIFKYHQISTNSQVGKIGGEQVINVADWAEIGNIQHEIMHALGFLHEHCRLDRDGYVYIDSSQLPSVPIHNFDIEGYPIGKYDTESIMHYSLCAYMKSNHPQARNMGQRINFSSEDIKCIKYIYTPPKCTFDQFNDTYYIQTYYECQTCWGSGSCYGVCEFCMFSHHRDHNLIRHTYQELENSDTIFVCDCGRYNHQVDKCTRLSTGIKRVKQSMFICNDCFDVQGYQQNNSGNTPGVCYPCLNKCHKGHQIIQVGVSDNFYCDCGLQCCAIKCQIP